jgi:hypothetical protein
VDVAALGGRRALAAGVDDRQGTAGEVVARRGDAERRADGRVDRRAERGDVGDEDGAVRAPDREAVGAVGLRGAPGLVATARGEVRGARGGGLEAVGLGGGGRRGAQERAGAEDGGQAAREAG